MLYFILVFVAGFFVAIGLGFFIAYFGNIERKKKEPLNVDNYDGVSSSNDQDDSGGDTEHGLPSS